MERGKIGRHYFICGPSHSLEHAIDLASEIPGIRRPVFACPRACAAAARLTELIEPVPVPP
jgi:hypothetical protein